MAKTAPGDRRQGLKDDILIQSTEEVERKRHLPGHVVRNAIKEGIAL